MTTNRPRAAFLRNSDGTSYLMPSALRNMLVFILLYFGTGYEAQAQNSKTEILWDNFGVPHIYAKNAQEMYYAFGWAQMNNHANLKGYMP